jgi:hypothetical protein
MALSSTQPLTEMSTGNFVGGKGVRSVGLENLPPSLPIVLKSGSLNLLEPYGPVQSCNGIVLLLPIPLPLHLLKKYVID